jgi:hypothetical protein
MNAPDDNPDTEVPSGLAPKRGSGAAAPQAAQVLTRTVAQTALGK